MSKPRNPVVRAARVLKAGAHQKSQSNVRQTVKQTLKNWHDDSPPNDINDNIKKKK